MKIFVTGAGGFIGGSIAAGLAGDGHQVVGLVRREEQAEELRAIGVEPRLGSL
ncbi:NAD-dependent epimerase/dehydratase family protein, partial [Burkholderia gladioli]